jgi:HJR/Mrr/RecB family endonuclease
MTSKSWRNNRRKYDKNVNDHIIFVLIILLAAAIYASQPRRLASRQNIVELLLVAGILLGIILLFTARAKLRARRGAHRSADSLVDKMSGIEFERYVANILSRQGYKQIQLTEHYDLGLDIIARKQDVIWGIQVKRYATPVGIAAVRQAVAALQHYECDRAMVITNSSFSPSARDLAASNNCLLVDGQQLLRWART